MTSKPLLLAALLLGPVTAADAQRGGQHGDDAQQARPPALFQALVRCRAISDDAERLRCFDAAAGELDQAAQRRDIVVVDRGQVRESRRRLFGLALPRLPIFGGGDNDRDAEEITQLDGTVASASQDGLGHWQVRLQDGSLWVQVDNNLLALRPRPGQPVTVVRGALGSYMLRVNRQPGIRVRRQL